MIAGLAGERGAGPGARSRPFGPSLPGDRVPSGVEGVLERLRTAGAATSGFVLVQGALDAFRAWGADPLVDL